MQLPNTFILPAKLASPNKYKNHLNDYYWMWTYVFLALKEGAIWWKFYLAITEQNGMPVKLASPNKLKNDLND